MMLGKFAGARSRTWVVVAASTCLFGQSPARGQATEGTTPTAAGVWRIDSELYSRGEDRSLPAGAGDRAKSRLWGGTELSVGVGAHAETRVGWQAWRCEEVDGAATKGCGDVTLSTKVLLAGDESQGAAWALMPYVKLPTAGNRFADDTVDGGALVIFGRPLGETGFCNVQLGVEDYGDGAGGREQGLSGSVVAGRCVAGRWTPYAEATASAYPWNGDSDSVAVALGGGLAWAGAEDGAWGLDFAAYAGVTRAATDVQTVLRVWVEWGGRAK